MKILILGGTGAIGQELVPLLAEDKNTIIVTSRQKRLPSKEIEFIQGNAKDIYFIRKLLSDKHFDVIVDFMLYSEEEFRERYELLLSACDQYIFFSSSRVYAESDMPICETSARLLDVSTDKDFLEDGEYSLTKAKEEDILKESKFKNWVIIRPYKTYSTRRLQLGVLEMEQWLYRAIEGKTVVALGDIRNLHTSLTYSKDTAKILHRILGDNSFNGEIFQIANPEPITWADVIDVYSLCIECKLGKRMKIRYEKDTSNAELLFKNKYRIKYDGLIDRTFDDSKIVRLMGDKFAWTPLKVGLSECINSAIDSYKTLSILSYSLEGMYDRYTGECANLLKVPGGKNRMRYLLHRIVDEKTISRFKKVLHK